ncbi:MAG TPA: alanine--glyoxylate aminotransferase family protein, partial [bacterium]
MSADLKNFLPGPTMVRPEVLSQLARPIIGHRTPEFRELMGQINPRLQRLLRTRHPVFSFTCTASAAMEA